MRIYVASIFTPGLYHLFDCEYNGYAFMLCGQLFDMRNRDAAIVLDKPDRVCGICSAKQGARP